MHRLHVGRVSSHFFRRTRHVQQPLRLRAAEIGSRECEYESRDVAHSRKAQARKNSWAYGFWWLQPSYAVQSCWLAGKFDKWLGSGCSTFHGTFSPDEVAGLFYSIIYALAWRRGIGAKR